MTTIESAYSRYCTKRFPLPTEQQVLELEQRVDVRLPDKYRQFVLKYNGGYFNRPKITPVGDSCPLDALCNLCGIGASHWEAELATPSDLALFDDNDPLQVLPIGHAEMGGLILLDTAPGEGNGAIFLKKAFGDVYWLTDELEAFFALLREPSSP